jgi:hypothetical protein
MTDHIPDDKKMVSPWRTLAERLGMEADWSSRKTFRVTVPSTVGGIPLCEAESQDMLIGRALRVAVTAVARSNEPKQIPDSVTLRALSVAGESRAIAALELLDAVEYPQSQVSEPQK